MADNTQNVETVVIEEPSDKVELAHDEKPRCSKNRVYIALGLLVVIAVSLIGTLLSFSPSSSSGVNEATLTEGTQSTFPTFDSNNDGYIDQNEMSNWMSTQIAARRQFTTPTDPEPIPTQKAGMKLMANGSSTPAVTSVQDAMGPCDFNHDNKISLQEAIQCVIAVWKAFVQRFGHQEALPRVAKSAASLQTTTTTCPTPKTVGFPGRVPKGWVGACQPRAPLWCFGHQLCHHHEKCHKVVIPAEITVTDTCCGGGAAANCTTCSCGASYNFVPHGHNARVASMCHQLCTFWCDDVDTGVPCW